MGKVVKSKYIYLYIFVVFVLMLTIGALLVGCNSSNNTVSPSEKELKMGTYVFDKAVDADSKENYSYFVAVTFEDNNFLSFVAYFNESTIGMPNNVYTFEDIPYVRDGDTIEISITSPIEVNITATIIDDYKISFSEPFRESRTCYLSYQEDFKFEEERIYSIIAELTEDDVIERDVSVKFDNGVIYKYNETSMEFDKLGSYKIFGDYIISNIESDNSVIYGKICKYGRISINGGKISASGAYCDIVLCFINTY